MRGRNLELLQSWYIWWFKKGSVQRFAKKGKTVHALLLLDLRWNKVGQVTFSLQVLPSTTLPRKEIKISSFHSVPLLLSLFRRVMLDDLFYILYKFSNEDATKVLSYRPLDFVHPRKFRIYWKSFVVLLDREQVYGNQPPLSFIIDVFRKFFHFLDVWLLRTREWLIGNRIWIGSSIFFY